MSDDLYERGMEVRHRLIGRERADQELAETTDFDRPFQDYVTRACFGEVWGSADLEPKVRSLITMALLAAQGRPGALRNHARGALLHGASPAELRGTVMQIVAYCGVPAAVEASRAAREALKEAGLE